MAIKVVCGALERPHSDRGYQKFHHFRPNSEQSQP